MTGITHILVPTDGSEGSLHAAAVAGFLARSFDAKVTLLFVQSDDSVLSHAWGAGAYASGTHQGMMSIEQIRSSMEQHARENELAETAVALGELNTEVGVVILSGHVSEEICQFATDNKIDHIVIGSHGRSGLKRAFLGSVSQAVANQATCPVTIVR